MADKPSPVPRTGAPLASATSHSALALPVSPLQKAGANPNVTTPKHITPLLIAAERGHAAACAALLAGGADPSVRTPSGGSPAYLAVSAGHADAVAALVAGGVDPNSTTPAGLTLLEAAARFGLGGVTAALCAGGADVAARDARGDTALHKLVASWRESRLLPAGGTDGRSEAYCGALQALLEAGADPWAINHAGKVGGGCQGGEDGGVCVVARGAVGAGQVGALGRSVCWGQQRVSYLLVQHGRQLGSLAPTGARAWQALPCCIV
jgi:ankyrin repeat protein